MRQDRTEYVPPKGCRYCGERAVLVRQTAPPTAANRRGSWAIFDTDSTGTVTGQHRCQAGTIPASKIAAANAGATHCGGTCGNATCPDVIAANPTYQGSGAAGSSLPITNAIPNAANVQAVADAADAALAADAFDMQAVYDALAELDAEAAKREPAHERRESTYRTVREQDADSADTDGITVYAPDVDRDYLIDVGQLAAIKRVIARVDRTGTPANIGLFGDAGSGKSTLGVQIAAMRRGIAVVCEASQWQTPDEVYAQTTGIDRESGKVIVQPSQFVRGVETPNATVIVNDIANVQNVRVQNGLNELLDPTTRATYVAALGRSVRVAPGVIIVGTWNTNTISASELSAQILSRFRSGCMMEVPFPEGDTLAAILRSRTGVNKPTADRLAAFAGWMRHDPDPIPVDMRGMISAATDVVDGASIGHALRFTVLSDMDESERTRAYTLIATNTGDEAPDVREQWTRPTDGTYAALGDVTPDRTPGQDSDTDADGGNNGEA